MPATSNDIATKPTDPSIANQQLSLPKCPDDIFRNLDKPTASGQKCEISPGVEFGPQQNSFFVHLKRDSAPITFVFPSKGNPSDDVRVELRINAGVSESGKISSLSGGVSSLSPRAGCMSTSKSNISVRVLDAPEQIIIGQGMFENEQGTGSLDVQFEGPGTFAFNLPESASSEVEVNVSINDLSVNGEFNGTGYVKFIAPEKEAAHK